MTISEYEFFGVDSSDGSPPKRRPGWWVGVEFSDYRKIDALNNSLMTPLAQSAAHYRHAVKTPRDQKSDALAFGSLVHHKKLEPESFSERYAVMPDFADEVATKSGKQAANPRATKAYKDRAAEWKRKAAAKGKQVIAQGDWERMTGVVDAIHAKESAAAYFRDGRPEVTIVWRDDETGIWCKARADYWQPAADRLVDLKTTRDAREFGRSIATHNYDRQAAWYLRGAQAVGIDATEFVFVVVESSPPFGVVSAPLDQESLADGDAECQRLLNRLHKAKTTGLYEPYHDPATFNKPEWAFRHRPELVITHKGKRIKT